MNTHPITTPASPSHASPHFDASCDSIESLTTSFAAFVVPTLETTTVTEVALGYHRNQQYSITAMTTTTGAVAERYAYTAYGQPTILNASGSVLTSSAIVNRYTYTGREWDETLGLHHFRARWMSPLAGRFLGRDPIGYEDGFTLYGSLLFLHFTDPNGESVHSCTHYETKLSSGLRMQGEKTSFANLVDRIKKILKTSIKFDIYWDFQGSATFKRDLCTEDCNCNTSASLEKREGQARGSILFGISVPAGAIVTISGDVRFNADFKIKSSKGGCTGGFKAEMCGFFSGGGGLKICVGRKIFGEVCLEFKLSCDVFGVCGGYGDGRSMPTSGKCTAKIAGSACIANGLLCGEMDIGNNNFPMPFLE